MDFYFQIQFVFLHAAMICKIWCFFVIVWKVKFKHFAAKQVFVQFGKKENVGIQATESIWSTSRHLKTIQKKRFKTFKSRIKITEKILKLFKNRGRGKNTFRNIDLMIIWQINKRKEKEKQRKKERGKGKVEREKPETLPEKKTTTR